MKRGAIIFMLVMSFLPLVSFFAYFFIQSILDDRTEDEIYLDERKKEHYAFKIDTMYRDRKNRNLMTMKGKLEVEIEVSGGEWENFFKVGDSIVKEQGCLQILIYRNDSLIRMLDYNKPLN